MTAKDLLPVAEAQARLLDMAQMVDHEVVPVQAANGRWLASDITAMRNQPWADLSAMDGYAIRYCDLPGPWTLSRESLAGSGLPSELQPGEAVRIFTGAPIPPGSDTVILQEDVVRTGESVVLNGELPGAAGRHVRRKGMDFSTHATILDAGVRLDARHLALCTLAGLATVPVRRKVRVALFSTGDELVPLGTMATDGQLPSSNAVMLTAMLSSLPVECIDLGIIPDDLARTTGAFTQAMEADVIVTTGGASVGDRDWIRPGFTAAGGIVDFWRIAMQPGKPLMAGKLGNALFLGLPGNPVSAFVTATLFLVPLIRHMSGAVDPLPTPVPVNLGAGMAATGARAVYARAKIAHGVAMPLEQQDSSALMALSRADALIVRDVNSPVAERGQTVQVLPI